MHCVGITKVIRKLYVPNFKYSKLLNRVIVKGGMRRRAAILRGKLLDKELGDFFGPHHIPCKLKESNGISSWLINNGYTFLHSQFPVRCTHLKIQTKIDLIMCKNNKVVLVEVKSGSASRNCKSFPLTLIRGSNIDDCLLHQHQLQCIMSKHMYLQTKRPSDDIDLILMYVDHKGDVDVISSHAFSIHCLSKGMLDILHEKNKKQQTKQNKAKPSRKLNTITLENKT